jgi:hypothetical protein
MKQCMTYDSRDDHLKDEQRKEYAVALYGYLYSITLTIQTRKLVVEKMNGFTTNLFQSMK